MIVGNVGPSWPPSDYDSLTVTVDGDRIGDLSTPQLMSLFGNMKLPGFDETLGREFNIRMFAQARQKVHNDAGRLAVMAWLPRSL
jgi:hypothetical protein